jgi:hypothetical protein
MNEAMTRNLTLCTLLLIATSASAQDWTGAIDTDWNNPGNWSAWPLDGENLTIDSANYTGAMADPTISFTSVFLPDRVFVQDAFLTIEANLFVADRFVVEGEGRVYQSNGLLYTDRLIVDLGGLYGIEDGSVSVTTVLAVANGSVDRPSTFSQVGGTLNVFGELAFASDAGEHSPRYRISSGTLTVDGDALWTGTPPGSGSGRLLVEGGTVELRGHVTSTAGSTMDLHIGLSGGDLTTLGALVDLANATDSIRITGGALHLDGNVEVRNDGVLWADPGEVTIDQQTELRGSGTYRFHIITISAGATLLHSEPAEIQVAAAWFNQGTFLPEMNTVAFTGQGPAVVSGGNFHGMRVANTSTSVQVFGTCTVSDALTLEQGLVHTQANDLLVLLDGATSTPGSDLSHVNGPMKKIGDEAFVFPVGKDGTWRRIGIQDLTDAGTEFTAEYFPEAYANTSALSPGLISVSSLEHWTLNRSGSSDDARVQLFWEDATASGIDDCNTLVVARWNGSAWVGAPSGTTSSCSGNDAGAVESDDALPDFAAFTFGLADGTNGVAEPMIVPELRPYPQPADEHAYLPLDTPTGTLLLQDHLGRTLPVNAERLGGTLRLDTTTLPAGSYTLQVLDERQVVARARVVVVH